MVNEEELRNFIVEMHEKHPNATVEKISDSLERKFDLTEDKRVRKFVIHELNEIRMTNYKRRTSSLGLFFLIFGVMYLVSSLQDGDMLDGLCGGCVGI